ncbi:uncharacterized protein HKW66_Vig0000990 [Vigna angularis]|uniref:Uncharacterized protein n=1 Tax=Phaseolus angularis TaxID=3914 RepID=A0A8T0LBT0_PHAAN|nr:uncharacterized protein HKW66_Vig0000990 [Vigna angularis]
MQSVYWPEEGLVLLVRAFSRPSNTLASGELGCKCKRSETGNKVSKLGRGTERNVDLEAKTWVITILDENAEAPLVIVDNLFETRATIMMGAEAPPPT